MQCCKVKILKMSDIFENLAIFCIPGCGLTDITVCTSALLFTADDMYKRMPKDGKI